MTVAEELLERLGHRIWWAQSEGRQVPCLVRPEWFEMTPVSDGPGTLVARRRAAAIVACRRHCPVLAECAQWAAAAVETPEAVTGVLGGSVYRKDKNSRTYTVRRDEDCAAARLAATALARLDRTPDSAASGGSDAGAGSEAA